VGLRHGGNTEGRDANLTDVQLRAFIGHKTATWRSSTSSGQYNSVATPRGSGEFETNGGQVSEWSRWQRIGLTRLMLT